MSVPFQITVEHDRIIRGDYFPSIQASQGTMVICHGYKGFKDWGMFPYAAEQLSQDLDVITFNFSHNGVGADLLEFTELEKFAVDTYSRDLEDLDVLMQAIRQGDLASDLGMVSNPSTHPMYLLGHSRGAGICLIYGFDHPHDVDGVISWNGITNVDLFSEEEKKEMRSKGRTFVLNGRTNQQMPLDLKILEDMDQHRERFNIIHRVKNAEVAIVLIQGTEDSQKLRKGSAALVEANSSISWIPIPDGNHTFKAVHPFKGTTKPLDAVIHETKQVIHHTWRIKG